MNSDSVFTDSLLVKYLFKVSHAVTKAISIDGILYVYCWLGTGNFPQEGVQFTNSTDNAKNSHPTYSDFQATRLWDERILRNNFSCLEVIKWSERINTETVLIIKLFSLFQIFESRLCGKIMYISLARQEVIVFFKSQKYKNILNETNGLGYQPYKQDIKVKLDIAYTTSMFEGDYWNDFSL